jgi:hypothetical protein
MHVKAGSKNAVNCEALRLPMNSAKDGESVKASVERQNRVESMSRVSLPITQERSDAEKKIRHNFS